MITIPKLEMHVVDACNLRCTGCTHYADHGLRGILQIDTGQGWLRNWGQRVAPQRFSLLGGEPLLHPDLVLFLRSVRAIWPSTELRLITNGLLLPRHPELWPVLAATETVLTISEHSRTAGYRERFDPALQLARERADEHGVRLEVRDCTDSWYKLYRGTGTAMLPFDDLDARGSWLACQTRECLTLRDDALWKCPPIAHLPVVAARNKLDPNGPWQPFLAYEALTLPATDDAIRQFVGRQEEPICQMCPSRLHQIEKSVTGAPAPW